MRDHADIVRSYGATRLGQLLRDHGLEASVSTPQRWADRNSIPGEYWATLARAGIATLDELAAAAAAKREAA